MLLDSEFSSFFQFLQWDDKLSEPESVDGQRQESAAEPETVAEPAAEPETVAEPAAEPETVAEPAAEPETVAEPAARNSS